VAAPRSAAGRRGVPGPASSGARSAPLAGGQSAASAVASSVTAMAAHAAGSAALRGGA